MRLAITADVHLRTFKDTPGRYRALENVFKQALDEKASTVLICGDLFDKDFQNYSDFEKLAGHYPKLEMWILPGNHDSNLSQKNLAGRNIRIFEKPEVIGDGVKFLIIPYLAGKTMGDVIGQFVDDIEAKEWVLCGHGDWLEGRRSPNPYEPGTYMPLTRSDLNQYQPAQVFLGHIHAWRNTPIHVPGSPCGLDISETGKRRFLLFDTDKNKVENRWVETEVTYQSCRLTVLPVEDEDEYIRQWSEKIKKIWAEDQPDQKKNRIRVQVQGVTQDKSSLVKSLAEGIQGLSFLQRRRFRHLCD